MKAPSLLELKSSKEMLSSGTEGDGVRLKAAKCRVGTGPSLG